MEISALSRSLPAAAAPAESIPTDNATENREVVRAVKALNSAEMFGDENQLRFQRDAETQRMIVRIVNRRTGEVVSQIPAEYVLRLAEDLKPKQRG
jgi:flagellar protein FlaG